MTDDPTLPPSLPEWALESKAFFRWLCDQGATISDDIGALYERFMTE